MRTSTWAMHSRSKVSWRQRWRSINRPSASNPICAEAYNNLGNALREQGQLAEAVAQYQEALRLKPDYAEAHNNLGNALREQGQLAAAVAQYQEALRLKPDYAEAHNNLGNALKEQGQLAEAVAQYQEAIRLKPDYAEAHNNLGNALREQGQLAEAVAQYQEALRLKPDYAEAHNNLGIALKEQGQLAAAVAQYQEALRLKPDYAEAHSNLGVALKEQGQLAEALAQYQEALRLKPDYAEAHSNMLFCLTHDPHAAPSRIFAEHCRWATLHATVPVLTHDNDPSPHRRLRLGYVSPDFRQHAVARFIEPVLAAHDHEQFQVFCYANNVRRDAVTQRLQQHADTWCSIVGWSDQQVAERIRQDTIDILVDLAGHTANNRLLVFARKPAPVQVTYIGYPNTTGLTTMDYRLTDAVMDPPGEAVLNTEELVRLPRGVCCFAPPSDAPAGDCLASATVGANHVWLLAPAV